MTRLENLICAAMEYVEHTQSGKTMPSIEELMFCGLVHRMIEEGHTVLSTHTNQTSNPL